MAVELPVILSQTMLLTYICGVATYALERDLIVILVAVELVLLATILNFAAGAAAFASVSLEVFILFILVVAAAESSLVLAIFAIYYNLGVMDTPREGESRMKIRSS